MFSIQNLNRRWKEYRRSRRVMENLYFRRSLSEVNQNQKSLESAYTQMTARAIESEKGGDHTMAVHWAIEAQKLNKCLMMNGKMKSIAETAHAIQNTDRAMKELLTEAGSMTEGFGIVEPGTLYMEAAELQKGAQIMLEERNQLLDIGHEDLNSEEYEKGEKYLQDLVRAAGNEKRNRILQEANQKLDQLQKNRNIEKNI